MDQLHSEADLHEEEIFTDDDLSSWGSMDELCSTDSDYYDSDEENDALAGTLALSCHVLQCCVNVLMVCAETYQLSLLCFAIHTSRSFVLLMVLKSFGDCT